MSLASIRYSAMSVGHDRLDAERTRDEVLVERIAGLLRRQDAAVDLLLEQRMVVRQLLEFLAAQPVAARIADVPDRHAVAAEHRRHDRRAHARAFGTRLRGFVDALVGGGDLLLQEQRAVRQAALDVDLGQLASRAKLRHHAVGHDVDRDAARDLARRCTRPCRRPARRCRLRRPRRPCPRCARGPCPGWDRLATSSGLVSAIWVQDGMRFLPASVAACAAPRESFVNRIACGCADSAIARRR